MANMAVFVWKLKLFQMPLTSRLTMIQFWDLDKSMIIKWCTNFSFERKINAIFLGSVPLVGSLYKLLFLTFLVCYKSKLFFPIWIILMFWIWETDIHEQVKKALCFKMFSQISKDFLNHYNNVLTERQNNFANKIYAGIIFRKLTFKLKIVVLYLW